MKSSNFTFPQISRDNEQTPRKGDGDLKDCALSTSSRDDLLLSSTTPNAAAVLDREADETGTLQEASSTLVTRGDKSDHQLTASVDPSLAKIQINTTTQIPAGRNLLDAGISKGDTHVPAVLARHGDLSNASQMAGYPSSRVSYKPSVLEYVGADNALGVPFKRTSDPKCSADSGSGYKSAFVSSLNNSTTHEKQGASNGKNGDIASTTVALITQINLGIGSAHKYTSKQVRGESPTPTQASAEPPNEAQVNTLIATGVCVDESKAGVFDAQKELGPGKVLPVIHHADQGLHSENVASETTIQGPNVIPHNSAILEIELVSNGKTVYYWKKEEEFKPPIFESSFRKRVLKVYTGAPTLLSRKDSDEMHNIHDEADSSHSNDTKTDNESDLSFKDTGRSAIPSSKEQKATSSNRVHRSRRPRTKPERTEDSISFDHKRRKVATEVIRVGDAYQAIIPSIEANYRPYFHTGDLIWDPASIDATNNQEEIYNFVDRAVEFNARAALMQSLHNVGYDIEAAKEEFMKIYQSDPELLYYPNGDREAEFHAYFEKHWTPAKDIRKATRTLKASSAMVLCNYYRWKGARRGTYQRLKRDAKSTNSDECEVCHEGGHLIVCDACHKAYHLKCLNPPILSIPEGDWYCFPCTKRSPAKLRRIPDYKNNNDSTVHRSIPLDSSTTSQSQVIPPATSVGNGRRSRAELMLLHKELFVHRFNDISTPGQQNDGTGCSATAQNKGADAANSASNAKVEATGQGYFHSDASRSSIANVPAHTATQNNHLGTTDNQLSTFGNNAMRDSTRENGNSNSLASRLHVPVAEGHMNYSIPSAQHTATTISTNGILTGSGADTSKVPAERSQYAPTMPNYFLPPTNNPHMRYYPVQINNVAVPHKFGEKYGHQGQAHAPKLLPGFDIPTASSSESTQATKAGLSSTVSSNARPVYPTVLNQYGYAYNNISVPTLQQHTNILHPAQVAYPTFSHPAEEIRRKYGQPLLSPPNAQPEAARRDIYGDLYEVTLPITSDGLLITVGKSSKNGIVFEGYRRLKNKMKGPAELQRVFINKGDEVISVNGTSCANLTIAQFREIIESTDRNSAVVLQVRNRVYNRQGRR
jgi:PHD-finger